MKHDNVELIREKNQIRVYELTPDDINKARQRRFYVVEWDEFHGQVKSVVPNDMPADSGSWYANGCNASAIGYVAGGRKRENALMWFRELT